MGRDVDNDGNQSSESDTSAGDFTQILDSQLSDSPSSSSGNKSNDDDADQLHYFQSTIPFDDTVMFDDELATQIMDDIDGETQVVDLGGDTQVVNYGAEVHAMDDLDPVENGGTQLFDGSDSDEVVGTDGEGTEKTEVVDDTDDFSDEDSGKRECTNPTDLENSQRMHLSKEDRKEHKSNLDSGGSEQHTKDMAGYGCKGFTSIRAASIRASGLAARNKASQKSESRSCSTFSSLPLKEPAIDNKTFPFERSPSHALDPASIVEKHMQIDGPRTGNRCCFGRSAVRKLFADDTFSRAKEADDIVNFCGGAKLPVSFHLETEFAGLSYIDSQEPGEASQANALDFVDNFLKVNIECNDEYDISKSTGGKSKPVLNAKGTQNFAKSANLINAVGERGIFDWDDNREDEGGGEFFRKKKEIFFASKCRRQKSSTYSKSGRKVGESRDKKQLHIRETIMGLRCSDSHLVLANHKVNDESENSLGTHTMDAKFRKNRINELGKHSNLGFKNGTTEMPTDMDIQGTTEARFDTHMAAEAMEDLCFEVHENDPDSSKVDEGCNYMPRGFHKGQVQEKADTIQSQKDPTSSNVEGRTRQSKLKRTGNKSKEVTTGLLQRSAKVRKQCDTVSMKELKGIKSDAKKTATNNTSKNLNRVLSDVDKRREKMSLKRAEVDTTDPSVASVDQMSVKKQGTQLRNFTPIARRTRLSVRENELRNNNSASSDFREEMNIPTSFCPRGKRTRHTLSSARQEVGSESVCRLTRSKAAMISTSLDLDIKRKTRSSLAANALSLQSNIVLLQQSEQGNKSVDINHCSISGNGTCPAYTLSRSGGAKAHAKHERSPRERCELAASACTTPVNCLTPVKEASPICMGSEYLKPSCRKSRIRSSLIQEFCSLAPSGTELPSPIKDTRKRRDTSMIHVLFSRHLDGDIIKQQKKILSQLGASEASSMSDATHFIADEFVRTRNMLEAIALGKPVVNHLWLESCGQACCHIEERNFILRDAKKEKEFGFSLPTSLARARQNPLLEGHRVLITPNTKPGKEILASLAKAVHGVVVERIGRTSMKDDKIPEELLIISCEEDYAVCLPFLEKGATVYSSELLLNGIVIQKLEYERHSLFMDHVKRTRSTLWLKKDGNQFEPVAKGISVSFGAVFFDY